MTAFFEHCNPSSPLNIMQLQYVWACKLCHFLGIRDIISVCQKVNIILEEQIARCEANPDGFLIEKLLAELEKKKDSSTSSFNKVDGYKHLVGQVQDVVMAGILTVTSGNYSNDKRL